MDEGKTVQGKKTLQPKTGLTLSSPLINLERLIRDKGEEFVHEKDKA